MDLGSPAFRDWWRGTTRLTPARITLAYLVFGSILLIVSDVLWPRWIADPAQLRRLQGIKGALEVLLTGGVIYLLVGRMRRQRERSERRYRNLIETSPAPITLFDGTGTILWGNDAVLELLGLEGREELVGRSIFEFVHPDDRETAEDELARVIERDEVVGPTHMRLQRDDGEVRHIRVSTAPGHARGERVGQAVVVDVTELRELEDELRRERDFIRSAIDELRDVFYVIDADGGLERWNAEVSAVTGYDDDEIASMAVTDFFPPEERGRIEEAIESAFETGESFVEADLATSEGPRRYEFTGARLERSGEPDRVVGIGRDITERKRMERELRENERRYRTLVEMSPDPIFVHVDGEIAYANSAMVDLVEAGSDEELVGTALDRYLDPAEHADSERIVRRIQRGEVAPTQYERTVVTLEGDVRHVEMTSHPIAYEGEPAVLTVVKDVTHRHRYEEMLTTLHDRTRAMMRADDRAAIADIVVRTVDELLDVECTLVYEFEAGDGLVPLDWSEAIDGGIDEMPAAGREAGALWDAFAAGEERIVEHEDEDEVVSALPVESALVLPVSNHGVLVIGTMGEPSLTAARREILHLLGENLDAAFDRDRRERELRERDRRLQRQNESLERLNRLNEVIREINRTLVQSSTESEIREGVCEQVAAADRYAFAWMAIEDPADGTIAPRAWSGVNPEYVDHLRAAGPGTPLFDLVEDAFREGSIQVARDVLERPEWEPRRSEALNRGYRSVAAVPVTRNGRIESVLVIHAEDGDVFDEEERTVLGELGRTIGYALRNVERVRGIGTDEHTEIELEIGDERLFTNRLARAGATVEFVGAIPDDGTLRTFLRVAGVAADDLEDRLSGLESVTDVQLLSADEGGCLAQLTIATPPLVEILRGEARIRALESEDGRTTCTVAVTGEASVRSLVEEIQAAYPDTELVARRRKETPVETRETFRERLADRLTEKQLDALRTAYFGGFYEWPRTSTNEELARTRDIAASTFQYHLRAAERKLISNVLEPA